MARFLVRRLVAMVALLFVISLVMHAVRGRGPVVGP